MTPTRIPTARRIATIVAAGTLTLGLAACGNDASTDDASGSADTSASASAEATETASATEEATDDATEDAAGAEVTTKDDGATVTLPAGWVESTQDAIDAGLVPDAENILMLTASSDAAVENSDAIMYVAKMPGAQDPATVRATYEQQFPGAEITETTVGDRPALRVTGGQVPDQADNGLAPDIVAVTTDTDFYVITVGAQAAEDGSADGAAAAAASMDEIVAGWTWNG